MSRPLPSSPSTLLRPAFLLLAGVGVVCPGGGARALTAQSPDGPSESVAEAVAPPVEGVDFRVYTGEGEPTSLAEVVEAALAAEVLLVGEEHDDMAGHRAKAVLLEWLLDAVGAEEAQRTVVLSLEMFERDVQYVLDEYLAGEISESQFLLSSRPWTDYERRYRPLVELARARSAPVVAANAPRRYVNRVTREGPASLESLSALARSFLPPLPYPGPSAAYEREWNALMDEAMAEAPDSADAAEGDDPAPAGGADAATSGASGDGAAADGVAVGGPARGHAVSPNAIWSQALWDASMGHAVTEALVRDLGALVFHVAGSFHVANGTGIPERIDDYRPGTRVVSVVMTKAADVSGFDRDEHAGLGDFVFLTLEPADPEG